LLNTYKRSKLQCFWWLSIRIGTKNILVFLLKTFDFNTEPFGVILFWCETLVRNYYASSLAREKKWHDYIIVVGADHRQTNKLHRIIYRGWFYLILSFVIYTFICFANYDISCPLLLFLIFKWIIFVCCLLPNNTNMLQKKVHCRWVLFHILLPFFFLNVLPHIYVVIVILYVIQAIKSELLIL